MSTRTRRLLHPITQTSQLIKATVGVGAALATILGSAHSCGLLSNQSVGLGAPASAVGWVGITPVSDTAESLGDSLRFVATLTDQHGAAIHSVPVRWSVADSSIVSVDSAGFVVARRAGVTRVQVTAGERSAIARVEVRQRPVALVLGPDSVIRVPEGAIAWRHYVFESPAATDWAGESAGTTGTTGIATSGAFGEGAKVEDNQLSTGDQRPADKREQPSSDTMRPDTSIDRSRPETELKD